MQLMKLSELSSRDMPWTAMLYCPPGVGKSTAIGLIAEVSEGNTLVLDVDRTVVKTLIKKEIVQDVDKVIVVPVENRGYDEKRGIAGTFADWTNKLMEITPEFIKANDIRAVAVDNISELERCILADLGSQGKNKGVPAQADYQYMQFKLVNSLRYMKTMGVNILWTAWQDVRQIVSIDGTSYTQMIPKISAKIVDNICGLCDVVGWIGVNKEGGRTVLLEATQNIYAKNQIDARKSCDVADFSKFEFGGNE